MLRIGVDVLPAIPKDTTDRNRTSPLAFTGNKFEFRMLGSSQSIARPNIALNTIMAEQLTRIADALEGAEDFEGELQKLISRMLLEHRRVIFDGNGYSDAWKEEAARRGLSNLPSTAEALPTYISQKNIDLVVRHGVFTETEFVARQSIQYEDYNKKVNIEARTMVDMAVHQILPAAMRYTKDLCDGIRIKQELGIPCRAENALVKQLSAHTEGLYDAIELLKKSLTVLPKDPQAASARYHNRVIPAMQHLRAEADALEELTDKSYWPYPTYSDLLFY
jgi:glutamine synthetase